MKITKITECTRVPVILPLYKGFMLQITYKWWPLTTLNRWPLYQIKIYSKMHRESTKVTVMSRWPLRQVWLYIAYPVCLSPMMSSLCPLPMGTRLSTALIPVCIGSFTEIRGIIPGAFTPTLALVSVPNGPWIKNNSHWSLLFHYAF